VIDFMPTPSWLRHLYPVSAVLRITRRKPLRSSLAKARCGARPRAYPASRGAVLGKLKRALLAGRSATRCAGSATPGMLCENWP